MGWPGPPAEYGGLSPGGKRSADGRGTHAVLHPAGGLAGNMPGIQSRKCGQIMPGSRMPAARQRREIPVAGSPAGDRQSQGLPAHLPHPQYLSAISRVLNKGGTEWDKWYRVGQPLLNLSHFSD